MKKYIHWQTVRLLHNKELRSNVWNLGIFILITFTIMSSSLILNNQLSVIEIKHILIDNFPLLIPLLTASTILSLFLTLLFLMNISKEVESGIYDLLLIGPLNEYSYIIGKFFSGITIFLIQFFFYFLWMILCVLLINLPLQLNFLGLIFSSVIFSSNTLSFGFLLFSISNKPRNSIILFIFINLLIGFIHIADFLISIFIRSSKNLGNDSLFFVRNILMEINYFFSYLSPFTNYFNSSQELIVGNFPIYFLRVLIMLLQSFLFLMISSWILRKKRDLR